MMKATAAPVLPVVWERPTIIPKPAQTIGTLAPVQSINSSNEQQWFFTMNPLSSSDIQSQQLQTYNWEPIIVPGEPAMQGFDILNDTPYYYKTSVRIPQDFDNDKIILRFHGVYSKAKVWVNGAYIREHQGGFTTWDCDITDFVTPSHEANIVVEIIDDIWDPSIGSKYAHHNMGGIIRSVELIAVPQTHLTRLHYTVDFDSAYEQATLHISLGANLHITSMASAQLKLMDHLHETQLLGEHEIVFRPETDNLDISFNIDKPVKWNAEKPYLYTMIASLFDEHEQLIEVVEVKVGFRKISFAGSDGTDPKEVYINGERIKLRGTCRHSIHPHLGRVTTPEMDIQDVILLREQNVNYVRTSHYPPSEEFLAACDELGMYVEEETAVNFQYANGPGPWRDDEPWYMNQLAEMIERDRSHPSVIIWSLANESGWRANEEGNKFRRQLQYARQEETSRPTKFSYPFLVEDGSTTDIYSAHYIHYTNDMDYHLVSYGVNPDELNINYSSPVIHDEYAHIACYNLDELERDRNVRNFWGESVLMMWDKIVNTHGALGGALWANIDDVFHLPEGVSERHQQHSIGTAAGYGEWGNMSDVWRRHKPEYWLTKKAYSPIRIQEKPVGNPGNAPLVIPISNWFNHTNLNEVTIHYSIRTDVGSEEQQSFTGPDIKPYTNGELVLPARQWDDHDQIHLQFQTLDGIIVDEFLLPVVARQYSFSDSQHAALSVAETKDQWTIRNDAVTFVYNKQSAMLTSAASQDQTVIIGGPHLHMSGVELGSWIPASIHVEAEQANQYVTVTIVGHYELGVKVQFIHHLYASGKFNVNYSLLDVQPELQVAEIGLCFQVPEQITHVDWNKSGLFSFYPEDHIGRLVGRAYRVRPGSTEQPDRYGERPAWPWKDDMRNFFLEQKDDPTKGLVTHDFLTMREHVHYYHIAFQDTSARLSVEGTGTEAARVAYSYQQSATISDRDGVALNYTGTWEQIEDAKCTQGTATRSNVAGASVTLSFYGTGVQLLYTKNKACGNMEIQIDDQPKQVIAAHSDIGMSLYQQRATFADLPLGQHSITIEVPAQQAAGYTVIDAFEILNDTIPPQIQAQFIVNNAWHYPGLGWGNYCGEDVKLEPGFTKSVSFRISNHSE